MYIYLLEYFHKEEKYRQQMLITLKRQFVALFFPFAPAGL